jgi:hypothetical protein
MNKITVIAVVLIGFSGNVRAMDDDGGFHTIREWRASGGSPDRDQESIAEVFDHAGITKLLAATKSVRLVRCTPDQEPPNVSYWQFESKKPIQPQLSLGVRSIELQEAQFTPLLKHLADLDHYGDSTICSFEPGVAIFIGDGEPEFIVICCFKCHDIHIVRRPTATHPMPHVSQLGMSPELEETVFRLAQTSFPKDEDLKTFTLAKRHRSKTPLESPSSPAKDPFAPSR